MSDVFITLLPRLRGYRFGYRVGVVRRFLGCSGQARKVVKECCRVVIEVVERGAFGLAAARLGLPR